MAIVTQEMDFARDVSLPRLFFLNQGFWGLTYKSYGVCDENLFDKMPVV
jgi:ABC-type histidine transport system ATPase subunit